MYRRLRSLSLPSSYSLELPSSRVDSLLSILTLYMLMLCAVGCICHSADVARYWSLLLGLTVSVLCLAQGLVVVAL